MAGILRTAITAARLATPLRSLRLPQAVTQAKSNCLIPFFPVDWIFRFFPFICRDRVRFIYRFNIMSFTCGFGYIMFFAHAPYQWDSYDHFAHSPLYEWVKGRLEANGKLDENLRVKVRHFYPVTEEE